MDKLKIAYSDIGYKDARQAVFRSTTVIAKASIPVLIITNRCDNEVPSEENGAILAQALGDVAHVMIKEGQGASSVWSARKFSRHLQTDREKHIVIYAKVYWKL